jgi:hypothetical protein
MAQVYNLNTQTSEDDDYVKIDLLQSAGVSTKVINIQFKQSASLEFTGGAFPIIMQTIPGVSNFNIELNGCRFNTPVTLNTDNITGLSITNDTIFNVDDAEDGTLVVERDSSNNLAIELNNVSFHYYGSTCISLQSNYLSINTVSSTNCKIILQKIFNSGLSDIVSPRQYLSPFKIHFNDIQPNPRGWKLGTIVENYNFVLDSNCTIYETTFINTCNFQQNSNSLTFDKCFFNVSYDGSANTYECITDGDVMFINACLIRPSPIIFNSGNLWNFIGSSDVIITIDYDLIIEMISGIYENFGSINAKLQKNSYFRLIGGNPAQRYSYQLGTAIDKLQYPIYLLLDQFTVGTSFAVEYFTESALGITNLLDASSNPLLAVRCGNTSKPQNPYDIDWSDQTGYALLHWHSTNHKLAVYGTFFNNGFAMVDPLFDLTFGGNQWNNSSPTFTYTNSQTQINMNREHAIVRNQLIYDASSISIHIPSDISNVQFSSIIPATVNFTNSEIYGMMTLNPNTATTINFTNSILSAIGNVPNITLPTNINNILTLTDSYYNPLAHPLALKYATFRINGSVIDFSDNSLIYNEGITGANANNTFRFHDLSLNKLDLTQLNSNGTGYNGLDISGNIIVLAQPVVQFIDVADRFNLPEFYFKIGVDASVNFASVTNNNSNNDNVITLVNTLHLTSNFLKYKAPTYDASYNMYTILERNTRTDNYINFPGVTFTTNNNARYDSTDLYLLSSDPSANDAAGNLINAPAGPMLWVDTDISNNNFPITIFKLQSDNNGSVFSMNLNTTNNSSQFDNIIDPIIYGSRVQLDSVGTYSRLYTDPIIRNDTAGLFYIMNDGTYNVNIATGTEGTGSALCSAYFINGVYNGTNTTLNITSNALVIYDNASTQHTINVIGTTDVSGLPFEVAMDIMADSSSNSLFNLNSGLTITTGADQKNDITLINNSSNSIVNINNVKMTNDISGNQLNQRILVQPRGTLGYDRYPVVLNPSNWYNDLSNNYDDMTVNRQLNITYNLPNRFKGSSKYFIVNNNNVLLNLSMSNTSYCPTVTSQQVYWPALYYIKGLGIANTTVLLKGDGIIQTAEAWDTTTQVVMTNYLNGAQPNTACGIVPDSSNNFDYTGTGLYVVKSGNYINYFRLLEVIALSAQSAGASATLTLQNKSNDNTTTNHTGKFTGFSNNISCDISYGWIDVNVNFNANNNVLFNTTNNIVDISLNSISGAINNTSTTYSAVYKQIQDPNINNQSVHDWLHDNFILLLDSIEEPYITDTNTIIVYGKQISICDYNIDPDNDRPLTYKVSNNITYRFNGIKNNSDRFNFINNVNIDISWNNVPQFIFNNVQGTGAQGISVTLYNIDSSQAESDTGKLSLVGAYPTDGYKPFTSKPNIVAYATNDLLYSTIVSNEGFPDNQVYLSDLNMWDVSANNNLAPNADSSVGSLVSTPLSYDASYNVVDSSNLEVLSSSIHIKLDYNNFSQLLNDNDGSGCYYINPRPQDLEYPKVYVKTDVDPNNTYNISAINSQTGERCYIAFAYVGILVNDVDNNSTSGINLNSNALDLSSNFLTSKLSVPRGKLIFRRYNGNNILSNDTFPTPQFTTTTGTRSCYYFRYRVAIIIDNMRDLFATGVQSNLSFNIGGNSSTNMSYTAKGIIEYQPFNMPTFVDIHVNNTDQAWNSSVSYSKDISYNNINRIYIVSSCMLNSTMTCTMLDNNNTYNMQQIIDKYFNGTLAIDPLMSTLGNNSNNNNIYNTSTNCNNLIYTFNSYTFDWYLLGDISMNVNLTAPTPTSSTTIIPEVSKTSTLHYDETVSWNQTPGYVKFKFDAAIDNTNDRETTDISNITFNNQSKWTPTSYTSIVPSWNRDLSGNGIPFNKFTKFCILFNTNLAGICINGSSVILPSGADPIKANDNIINFTFTDENGYNVTDLDIAFGTDASGATRPEATITPATGTTAAVVNAIVPLYDGSNNTNYNWFVDASGDYYQAMWINRKSSSNTPWSESSYTKLNINFTITNKNILGTNTSNMKNLSGTVTTIDYSHTGLVSTNMSQVFLGNWRITPTGDGQSLLFRHVNQGKNPYVDAPVRMSSDCTLPTSSLFVNNILPHISIDNPSANDTYNYPSDLPQPPV